MTTDQLLDYYRQQSPITDPGHYSTLYDELPHDLPVLVHAVQGVLIHPSTELLHHGYHIEPEEIDNALFGERRIEDLLGRIQRRYQTPLTETRPPGLRIGAICRNFAVLLVSMLRYQGIPARARVGFGSYFSVPYAADHRIAEYWDAAQESWVLVDPMIDEVQRTMNNVTFNLLDIGSDGPFLLAGDVWQRCRAGMLDPQSFGDAIDDLGLPPIRYALLQDFAYLNKCEVLGCDDWGELITKPEADLNDDDLALLDQLAFLTTHVDAHLEELCSLFGQTVYGKVVSGELALKLSR